MKKKYRLHGDKEVSPRGEIFPLSAGKRDEISSQGEILHIISPLDIYLIFWFLEIMSSYENNGIWINMNSLKWKVHSSSACAENTEKRLKSQVKRHSIELHKIIFSPTIKFQPHIFFHIFWSSPNFVDLRDPQNLC